MPCEDDWATVRVSVFVPIIGRPFLVHIRVVISGVTPAAVPLETVTLICILPGCIVVFGTEVESRI